jgi:phage anti-repressor protein
MSEYLSLQNYLKKFTPVNNKFIDDFFGLYNENTKDTDFVINIDSVSTWLKIIRGNIKKTLTETYRENIDYKVSINKSTTAGRPSESIFLTPDCFKRICMLTKSSKGEEVRSYYIQLEKHLDKYKDNIINDLRNRVKVLERNMKPIEIPKDEGVIYVLKTNENTSLTDIYKIGSSDDFKSRLATHHSSHADNVEVSYVYKTSDVKGVERCLKAVLKDKQYRKRKEFYQIDLEILKKLITNCGDSLLLVKKSKSKNRKTSNKVSGGGQNNNTQSNYFIFLHK